MSFTTENYAGVSPAVAPATQGFVFNHSMLRVKDPKVALDFYTRVMGMRLLRKPRKQISRLFNRSDGFAMSYLRGQGQCRAV